MSTNKSDITGLNKDLQMKNLELEKAFEELDRRVYHLKTLNDISRDIFSTVEFKSIIDHFLLMVMGNFGVIEGFAVALNPVTGDIMNIIRKGDIVFSRKGDKNEIPCAGPDRAPDIRSGPGNRKFRRPHSGRGGGAHHADRDRFRH